MKLWIIAAALPLVVACSADRGDGRRQQQQSILGESRTPSKETFALGSDIEPSGAVPQIATGDSFSRGGEVYLSIEVSSASADQQVKVEWVDARGRVVRRQEGNVPAGARYVWFSTGPTARWMRGPHRAVITINGRTVSEKPFALL